MISFGFDLNVILSVFLVLGFYVFCMGSGVLGYHVLLISVEGDVEKNRKNKYSICYVACRFPSI